MTTQTPPYLIQPHSEADQRLSTPVKYLPRKTIIRYKIPTHMYLRIKFYARQNYLRMGAACMRLIASGLTQHGVTSNPAELIGLAAPPKPYYPPAGKPDKTSPQGS